MVKFGSAKIGETGKINNNKAGDQTKKEVSIENGYMHSKGWLAFKFKNKKHADAAAQAMIDMCNNDFIGYDQNLNERIGVVELVKAGVKIKDIKTPTECDCSAGVRACILEATGKLLSNFNTASAPDVFAKSGLFEPAFEVKSLSQLEKGMILVTKTKGHTVIVVEGAEPTGTNKPTVDIDKEMQQNNKPTPHRLEASQFKSAKMVGNYTTITKTTLRVGAGEGKASIIGVPCGAKLKCWGYYNVTGLDKWLAVVYNGSTGYINANYLKRL